MYIKINGTRVNTKMLLEEISKDKIQAIKTLMNGAKISFGTAKRVVDILDENHSLYEKDNFIVLIDNIDSSKVSIKKDTFKKQLYLAYFIIGCCISWFILRILYNLIYMENIL